MNSFYVDDLVSGEINLEKCLSLYQKSKKCLSEVGFNLRKWISNSPKLFELLLFGQDRARAEKPNYPESHSVVEDTEKDATTTMGYCNLEELHVKNEHNVLGLN